MNETSSLDFLQKGYFDITIVVFFRNNFRSEESSTTLILYPSYLLAFYNILVSVDSKAYSYLHFSIRTVMIRLELVGSMQIMMCTSNLCKADIYERLHEFRVHIQIEGTYSFIHISK